jgi:DNA-binding MarR family transcriptional regulator
MSLVSLAVGFSILGVLIIMKRDYAELNGVADGSSIATVGGISAILIGTVFLVTACLYLWVRVRCSVAFPVRPQTLSLTELGRLRNLDRSTVGRNAKVLERMHLVQAVAGEDRREAALTFTAKGTKAGAEAAPLWERAQATIERAMDGGEAARLLTLLKAL